MNKNTIEGKPLLAQNAIIIEIVGELKDQLFSR